MSKTLPLESKMFQPKTRWIRWVGYAALVGSLLGVSYLWKLYALPDQLGTIFYNAYLGDEQGQQSALDELNSLSTYYENTDDPSKPNPVATASPRSSFGLRTGVAGVRTCSKAAVYECVGGSF